MKTKNYFKQVTNTLMLLALIIYITALALYVWEPSQFKIKIGVTAMIIWLLFRLIPKPESNGS